MSVTIPVTIAAALILFGGAIGITVYSRRNAIKDARNHRTREFLDFVERFRSRILDPYKRPDFWVPYFKQKLPELRRRFDAVASDLPRKKRRQLSEQIVSLVPFFLLPPEEIYEREEEIKAAMEQLNREKPSTAGLSE
jgi:hypothetical protein